nr:PREDICTED: uncharacterized protein DDB_G0283697-like isoform X1 [Bemisia tabaci]
MSSLETEVNENIDISDALINEAARLENEYRIIEEVETPGIHPNASFEDGENPEVRKANSIQETSSSPVEEPVKTPSLSQSSPSKNPESNYVKKEANSTPEKRKAENSSLKRQPTDDLLDTLRPQPPEAKQLKKSFKIPKLSKKNAIAINKPSGSLTEEQSQFLAALERDFSHRYTDQDEDYVKAANSKVPPPIIEDFFCPPRRKFNRPEGSSHYDRNNRNSSPYGHHPRHYQHKYSRDYSNSRDYPSRRDYPSNRDHRNREYPDRDNPNYRENSGSREDHNSRYQHQRHQQRFQPY